MAKIKIITVKGKNPEERVKKIEEIQNINENVVCKGSVYYQDKYLFYADIYFIKGDTEIKEVNNKQIESDEVTTSKTINTNKTFTPTKEQLERWSKIKPTKKTYGLLISKGLTNEEIKKMTQLDAYYLINNLKKENI